MTDNFQWYLLCKLTVSIYTSQLAFAHAPLALKLPVPITVSSLRFISVPKTHQNRFGDLGVKE